MEGTTLDHGGNFQSVTCEHVFAICDRCNKQSPQWVIMGDILFPKVGLTALQIGTVIKGHNHCIKIELNTIGNVSIL